MARKKRKAERNPGKRPDRDPHLLKRSSEAATTSLPKRRTRFKDLIMFGWRVLAGAGVLVGLYAFFASTIALTTTEDASPKNQLQTLFVFKNEGWLPVWKAHVFARDLTVSLCPGEKTVSSPPGVQFWSYELGTIWPKGRRTVDFPMGSKCSVASADLTVGLAYRNALYLSRTFEERYVGTLQPDGHFRMTVEPAAIPPRQRPTDTAEGRRLVSRHSDQLLDLMARLGIEVANKDALRWVAESQVQSVLANKQQPFIDATTPLDGGPFQLSYRVRRTDSGEIVIENVRVEQRDGK